MFARGGAVRRMQEGGDPMMAPPMQDPMAMAPAPAGMPAPQEMPMDQAAQAAMQQGIDPAVLDSMLQDAAGSFAALDAAENAGDYEQMINAIRGDQLPLQERRMELADVVGEADAAQTPDSVLTLIQPIMQIAAVDQGIGSMAPEVMETPVEGDMAGGIMSMVNMAEPEPSAEGSAPVNFEQGGAVLYMQQGGVAMPDDRLNTLYEQQKALYSDILGQDDAQQEYEDQKRMTQAQMLFDIAQGGLMFATPGERQMSPAERLAQAFTPVIGNIGARAGELQKFKQAQKAEDRQVRLSALQSAQSQRQDELNRASAAENVKPGETYQIKDAEGTVLWQGPVGTVGQQQKLIQKYPNAVSMTEYTDPKEPKFVTFTNPDDKNDFITFNVNNPSQENQRAIQAVQFATNEDGTYRYRVTGNFTYPTDKDTSASFVNFSLPGTDKVETVDLSTKEGKARAKALQQDGYVKAGSLSVDSSSQKPNLQTIVNINDPSDIRTYDFSDPEQREEAEERLSRTNYLAVNTPSLGDLANDISLGNSLTAKFMELTSDPEIIEQYKNNTVAPRIANLINSYVTDATVLRSVVDPKTGTAVAVPGLTLPPILLQAIEERAKIEGASLPLIGGKDVLDRKVAALDNDPNSTGRIKFNADGSINFDTFKDDHTFIITGVDLTKSQTWTSSVNRFFNNLAGQIGAGYFGESGQITSMADTELNALADQINRVAREGVDGRVFAYDVEMIKEQTQKFRPGGGKTDYQARDQLATTRRTLAQIYNDTYNLIQNPQDLPKGTSLQDARKFLPKLENLLAETTAAIAVYDRYLDTEPMQDTMSDRAQMTRTSRLPRASGGGR